MLKDLAAATVSVTRKVTTCSGFLMGMYMWLPVLMPQNTEKPFPKVLVLREEEPMNNS